MTTAPVLAGGPGWRGELTQWTDGTRHPYLSCACLHGRHDQCGVLQRARGDVSEPHCKFCPAVCLCAVCRHDGGAAALASARAFYRGDPATGALRSARVTRLHVLREDGHRPGEQGLCGTGAGRRLRSHRVILDPMPVIPPLGLRWCPGCVGQLAERAGFTGLFVVLLAGRAVAS